MFADHGEIRAYGEREGCGDQPWLPPPIPSAYHDGDSKHDQPAFHYVGEQEGGNQSERGTKDSESVAQNGRSRRRDVAVAKKGEFPSHAKNPRTSKSMERVTLVPLGKPPMANPPCEDGHTDSG